MSCFILNQSPLAVHSPYSQDFAARARMVGGNWDRAAKLWRFPGFSLDVLQNICEDYYPGQVAFVDSIPQALPPVDHGHFGTVNALVRITVTVEKAIDMDTRYGATRLHVMRDDAGHVFVWFASSARFDVGARISLDGKIKAHNVRDGVSQTVLTRCKKV